MKPIAHLWSTGIRGKLAVGAVTLLVSCCMLGAFGTLIGRRAIPPTANLLPVFAASARTILPTAAATDIPRKPAATSAATASVPATNQLTQPADLPTAAVVRVVDGDTAIVRLAGENVRVRLIGIDTPEIVDPRKPVQCFAREASDKAHALLDGQIIALEADPSQDDKDRYGRLLRYIWLPDGRLFNYEMIAQGYAFEYTYCVPYTYQDVFKDTQRAAREQQIGLWSPATYAGDHRPADNAPAVAPAPSPKPRPSLTPKPPPHLRPSNSHPPPRATQRILMSASRRRRPISTVETFPTVASACCGPIRIALMAITMVSDVNGNVVS